ncbi:MAG: acyltransferase [Terracidiphilus sp.]
MSEQNRIPTLDGWRAVAILLVLVAHYQANFYGRYFFSWLEIGHHGVSIFFVISGYLITTLLISAERIDLRRFYLRRLFRLMPAAWTYLLFLFLLTAFTRIKALDGDIWGCLFFYRNYLGETATTMYTDHFWSLSLEEQFYLFWPPLLALLGRRRAGIVAVVAVVAISVVRFLNWNNYNIHWATYDYDAPLTGCLLALALDREKVKLWFRNHGRVIFVPALLIFLFDIWKFHMLIPFHECIAIALMIGATVTNPGLISSHVLENQHLKLTGLISYSIYLWQQALLRPIWGFLGFFLLPIAAFVSWKFIEQPGINLGRRLMARKQPRKIPAVENT